MQAMLGCGAERVSTLLELAALQSVHGLDSVFLTDKHQQQLLELVAAGALEEEAAAEQLGSQDLRATLRIRASCPRISSSRRSDRAGQKYQQQPKVELELCLSLPPTYSLAPVPAPQPAQLASGPVVAAAAVEVVTSPAAAAVVRCSVSAVCCTEGHPDGGGVGVGGEGGRRRLAGREWCDCLVSKLATLAQEAASEGRPCLHELYEHAQAALDELVSGPEADAGPEPGSGTAAAQPASGSGAQTGRGGGSGAQTGRGGNGAGGNGCSGGGCVRRVGKGGGGETQVLLLRLDHMHNRALYGRTIGSWIRELGLTGRLIFQGNLILVLLEGDGDALRQYLVRHRTESVDEDSRGRKCKERMMQVIVQQPVRSLPQTRQQHQEQHRQVGARMAPGDATPAVVAMAAPAASERAFPDYREVQLEALDQVGELLRRVGLGEWLRPAAGLR